MFDLPPIEPVAEIGVHHVQYEDLDSDTGELLRLGLKFDDLSIYLFGGKDDQEHRIKGQGVAQNNATSYGLGLGYNFHPKFKVFLEGGLVDNDATPYGASTNEMIRNQLWTDHSYDNRYRPGARPWHDNLTDSPTWKYTDIYGSQMTTEYDYTMDDGYLYRIGMSWNVFEHLAVSASYRISGADVTIDMWDVSPGLIPERHAQGEPDCGCWWQNKDEMEFNGWEIGVLLTW